MKNAIPVFEIFDQYPPYILVLARYQSTCRFKCISLQFDDECCLSVRQLILCEH